MGKDQRSKKHGLDIRQNRKLKREREQQFAAKPIVPKRQGRGQR